MECSFNNTNNSSGANPSHEPFTFDNRYRLIREIGKGGMGQVYMVQDTLKDNMVFALKTIKQGVHAISSIETDIFRNEYEIMTRLKHPNLTRIYEFGYFGGSYYIVMEYIKGCILSEKELEYDEILNIIVQILRALEYIHSRNLVYRDLKPHNIMLKGNTVKLLDFGLCGDIHQKDINVGGSLLYMAPESLRAVLNFSMDIFSLGLTFYELLTRAPFYDTTNSMQAFISLLRSREEFQAYQAKRLDRIKNRDLRHILYKMTSYDFKKRYQNCSSIISDLNRKLGCAYPQETRATKHSYVLGNDFANRKEELKKLKTNLFSKKRARFFIYSGTSGIGKTRLFNEFRKICKLSGIYFFEVECMEGEIKKYITIGNILSQMIAESSNILRDQYGKYLKLIIPDHIQLRTYEPPVIYDNPKLLQEIIIQNVLDFIIDFVRSVKNYAVIYLDDLQWIDFGSELLLRKLIQRLNLHKEEELYLVIYANMNEDKAYQTESTGKLLSLQGVRKLSMNPLNTIGVYQYIKNVFGAKRLHKSIKEAIGDIMEKVGSNPLFLQEFIKSLLDKNIIVKEKEYWKLLKPVDDIHIPKNIKDIVRDKLRVLYEDAGKRKILKILSLLRIAVNLKILMSIINKIDISHAVEVLLELENLEIITSFKLGNDLHYSYSNSLIKNQVRDSIGNKSEISYFLAEALESAGETEIMNIAEEIAYHYLEGKSTDKAMEYYEKCGDISKSYFFNEKALKHYEKVLAILTNTGNNNINKEIAIYLKIGSIMDLTGNWENAMDIFSKALKLSEDSDDPILKADCLNNLSWLVMRRGNNVEATLFSKKALEIAEPVNYKKGIGTSYGNIGLILMGQGNYTQAMQYYEKQYNIYKELGDDRGISNAIGNMGLIYSLQGEYKKAIEYYDKQFKLCSKLEDKRLMGTAMGNLGIVYWSQGYYDKAVESYKRVLSYCRELGDKRGLSLTYGNMGLVCWIQGEFEKAMQYYEKSLKIFHEIGDKREISTTYTNMGLIFFDQGEYKKAMKLYEKSISISQDIGHRHGLSIAVGNMANIHYELGEYEKAQNLYENKLSLCRELGDQKEKGRTAGNVGNIYYDRGDYKKALEYFEEFFYISGKIGDNRGIAVATGAIGRVYAALGNFSKALEYFDEAIERTRSLNSRYDLSLQLLSKAHTLINTGRFEEALPLIREAGNLAEKIKNKDIIFSSNLLRHKIENDKEALLKMLKESNANKEQSAEIFYEMWKMTGDDKYNKSARISYEKLFKKIPKHDYHLKIQELKQKTAL